VLCIFWSAVWAATWQFDAPYPYRWMLEDIDEQVELHSRQTDHVKRSEAFVLDAWDRPLTA
jgi:hypothetical protein